MYHLRFSILYAVPAFVFLVLLAQGCQSDPKQSDQSNSASKTVDAKVSGPLFQRLTSSQTGIDFINKVTETPTFNYFLYDAVYQGAGVGVGDINADGLPDLFFSGNSVSDKLYLNKGKMRFEDITQKAGIGTENAWSTGVSFVDINADGNMDIYVCRFLYDEPDRLKNRLYINNGDLTFDEKAAEYGIADAGYSIQANFFDYDKDGHLDLYVANQPPNSTVAKKALKNKIDFRYTDRLYHNNGNGTFTDVTDKSGIKNYSFSLSATVGDLNLDGWPDIYVACDYEEPDYFYQNNGDGTFTNIANEALRHISNFSMGADIADINNDGWPDIYTADMVADDNVRLKTNMSGMNPEKFWGLADIGYHYQYMFNSLQLNNGNGRFSEIGQLAGVSNTDWSWSPLFADFDNDGFKDLVVTNGLYRDLRNNDLRLSTPAFIQQKMAEAKAKGVQNYQVSPLDLIQRAPSVPIENFIYKNNGDLTFTPMRDEWGFNFKGFSQGAAYADFDNDGDLDVVMNNLNAMPTLFENKKAQQGNNSYLQINLVGSEKNIDGIGAQVEINVGDMVQTQQNFPVRGFMSCSDRNLHFGLGKASKIDQLIVRWPDGKESKLTNITVNQRLEISHKDARNSESKKRDPLFFTTKKELLNGLRHVENNFDDYSREILIPHKMSSLGPCLATADVNGDGLGDFYLGGSAGELANLYLQKTDGSFQATNQAPWRADIKSEDVSALFFDADGDSDMDLYVVSGGNDFASNDPSLVDRIYINDGKGNFKKSKSAIPSNIISGSCAVAADYDADGDLDLFIGGRQVPGKYGYPTASQLLKNENGKFKDVTEGACKEWLQAGMVTDASWLDLDKDGDQDLVIVGEWMPITFYQNDGGVFTNITEQMGTEATSGWWNKIELADIDNDGDQDLIVGNLGLNIKYKASVTEPFKLFVKDFDGNGSNDVYLGYYDHDGVCYPVRGRECSSQQLPFVKAEFPTYDEFAHAPIETVLKGRMEGAVKHEATMFSSVWLENLDGTFTVHPLPNAAQVSPIFGICPRDWNGDGHMDILTAGNYYDREVETTRSDAGIGCLLLGDGKGNFENMPPSKSGLSLYQDVRDIVVVLNAAGQPIVLVANNNADMEALIPEM